MQFKHKVFIFIKFQITNRHSKGTPPSCMVRRSKEINIYRRTPEFAIILSSVKQCKDTVQASFCDGSKRLS